jgi:hypothetical protein
MGSCDIRAREDRHEYGWKQLILAPKVSRSASLMTPMPPMPLEDAEEMKMHLRARNSDDPHAPYAFDNEKLNQC